MTVVGFPSPPKEPTKRLDQIDWNMSLGKPHMDINTPLDSSYKSEPPIEVRTPSYIGEAPPANDLARYKDGICQQASKLVNGARGEQHGDMVEQHKLAARLWTAYLGMKITAEEVATCMELLKISRAKCGTADPDHYIDRAGYAEVSWECRNAGC